MSIARALSVAALLLAAGTTAVAQSARGAATTSPPPPRSAPPPPGDGPPELWHIELDQDVLFGPANEDRDYTMGLAVERFRIHGEGDDTYPNDIPGLRDLHEGLDRGARWFGLPEGPADRTVTSMGFGAVVYTPDDLGSRAPVTDDRPYANLLYYSERRVEETAVGALGTELRVGVLGTQVADHVQTAIHRWSRARTGDDSPIDPEGWDNQISDGGEPTLLYRISTDRVLDAGDTHDLAFLTDLNLGYQVNASAGFLWRIGRLRNPSHTTPFDPISRADFVAPSEPGDLYGWLGGRVRAVGYDALLQGQFRSNVYEIDSRDVSRLVGHAALGVTANLGDGFQLTYSINARTHEIDDPGRTHYWGALGGTLRF